MKKTAEEILDQWNGYLKKEDIESKARNVLQDFRRRNDYPLTKAVPDMLNIFESELFSQQPATPVSAEEILYNTMYENNFTYDSFPAFIENESSVDVYDICCKAMESLKQFRPISVTEEQIKAKASEQVSRYMQARNNPTDDLYKRFVNVAKWAISQVKPMTEGEK